MEPLSVALFIACLAVFYMYLTRHKNYWRNQRVPYNSPLPVWGNLKPLILLEKSPGPFLGDLYNSIPALGQRFLGIFLFNCEPALLIRDPDLIKRILIQDFDHFRNRNVDCCDSIGLTNLFVVRDAKWKYLRTKLSPTFTSGKMKLMFVLMKEVASELTKLIMVSAADESAPLQCEEIIAKYTTDVINCCAFGIRSNSLSDPKSQFRHFGKKIFNTSVKRSLETRSFFFMHWIMKTFRFVFFEKESSKFMTDVFGEILAERERDVIAHNDFVDVLLKLKKDLRQLSREETASKEVSGLGEDSVLAQAALFYTAGFETTAVTIISTLYELALQPHLQGRLRQEIMEVLEENGGNLEYDALSRMKYLEMVVSETLRKYPPMPFIDRVCTKDYKIPDSGVTIKKGTPIFISLFRGLHYDETYFPDPETYDPERFSDERRDKLKPYSYLPFGEGPHICLGMRFGLMNTKTALALILSKLRVETCEKTQIPMEMHERTVILRPKTGVYLKFYPVQSDDN